MFDETVDGKQKVIDLKKNYGLPTTVEFEEEVEDMTAYTASVEQKGISKGFSQGFSQGLSQGIDRGIDISLIDMIIKKVKKYKSIDQIADELEESVDDIRPKYDAVITNPGKTAEEIYNILRNEGN